MIPAAIAITTNAMTPMTIPKIIATLPFLVLGLTVVAGLFGSDVTNKKQNLQEMQSSCAVLVTVPTACPEGFSSGTPK